MMFLAALVLTAAPVSATPDVRLEQLHAASAVWLVSVDVRLRGEFVKEEDGERIGTDAVTKLGMWGTATAVSAHGSLLTNRHIVDPRYLVAVTCKMKLNEYAKGLATSAQVNFTFFDVAGEPVTGVATVIPKNGDADVCIDAMHAQWDTGDGSHARILALDELSDLALVELDVSGIPFIVPESRTLTNGDKVYSLGYDGRNQRLVRLVGVQTAGCSGLTEEVSDDDVIFLPQPQPLSESTIPIRQGMSGGPVLNGAALMGINVMSDAECPDDGECTIEGVTSNAIPGYYAVAWYWWVIGQQKERPTLCAIPPDSSESHSDFDPFAAVKHK